MTGAERERFDALLEDAIDSLPHKVRELLEEIPVIVLDEPTAEMKRDLARDGTIAAEPGADDDLMGLHSGTALTERSVEHSAELPSQIHIFREGIVEAVGGWGEPHIDDLLYEEIRITLLHEIGHHFGLDEEDLDRLGYG
ncbi:MAG: metallopeptidase family protein [Phycisphaerae bacterium]|nr:metallopeptidase family protein [Phycisphaerae bacterium]